MSVSVRETTSRLGEFAATASSVPSARRTAAVAFLDTIGVALAGALEPAAEIVSAVVEQEGTGTCRVFGRAGRAGATGAALANGTAAHALDYDDMCFVSLAHPSAPLVPAAMAAGELASAPGSTLLDAYIVGFEIEARLGRAMNPRHYERGWHCTSTIGSIGAAAAAARMLGLDVSQTCHALAIAASEASGLKENFGTMGKPLHAGLAARNGVLAALLAQKGLTASQIAIDGPQGFLVALDAQRRSIEDEIGDLGRRWEILDTGISVKLYPSCAATHPTLDALLDLKRGERFEACDVEEIEVRVDSITPSVLIHDRPATGLEGKFSLPFCAASAVLDGEVGIDTFGDERTRAPEVLALLPRIKMRGDASLDGAGPPLTQARIRVRLRGGRILTAEANGARGYPERPASDEELTAKFLTCARRALPHARAQQALDALRAIERVPDIRSLTDILGL